MSKKYKEMNPPHEQLNRRWTSPPGKWCGGSVTVVLQRNQPLLTDPDKWNDQRTDQRAYIFSKVRRSFSHHTFCPRWRRLRPSRVRFQVSRATPWNILSSVVTPEKIYRSNDLNLNKKKKRCMFRTLDCTWYLHWFHSPGRLKMLS